jgi:hypothetical protein
MTAMIQTYIVTVAIAVLLGVCSLIMTNISPIASASPLSATSATTTNQTGNQTGANITTTTAGGSGEDQETVMKQLDLAMKALDSGDKAAAEGYMKEADKTLSEGEAKTHLGEAMKALQSDDTEGAKMHAQAAQGYL